MITVNTKRGYSLYINDPSKCAVSKELLHRKEWNKSGMDFLKNSVKKGDIFIDGGAHIGTFSLYAALLGCTVISFEPDKDNFSLLSQNIKLNNFNNATLINNGISDSEGEFKQLRNEENYGDHRILTNIKLETNSSMPTVPITTIDNTLLSLSIDHINFLKLDIQGCEVKALKGARNIISNSTGAKFYIEYWPEGLSFQGNTFLDFYEELEKQGIFVYHGEKQFTKNDFLTNRNTSFFCDLIGEKR